jgi:hypothetical protein
MAAVWNVLCAVFILATISPGVLCVVLLVTGRLRLDASSACAIAWLLIVLIQFCRGIRPGIRDEVREQRRLRGRCLSCGYDVRASPGRCPECGARTELGTRGATADKSAR